LLSAKAVLWIQILIGSDPHYFAGSGSVFVQEHVFFKFIIICKKYLKS